MVTITSKENNATVILKNVDKILDKVKRIDNLSIQTEQGKIYGLIGPNGSGKTTLLNLITGLYKPDTGTIRINGLDSVRITKRQENKLDCSHKTQRFIQSCLQRTIYCFTLPYIFLNRRG